jgi:hypothetical protein
LLLGEVALAGLAAVVVAVLAGRRGMGALAAEAARASGIVVLVLAVVTAIALVPSARRAWRRVRGPAFRANAARYADLPRWYVVPAAFVGGVAAEATAIARRWIDAEARSSSGCFAAGVLVALLVAAGSATGAWFEPLAALGAAGGLLVLHRYQFS